MKSIRALLLAAFALSAFALAAEVPAGYYNSLNGKKDAALKTEVYTIIHNFTRISSYSDLPKYFMHTDVYPESMRWWDMYSSIPLYAPSFSGLNREHSFPKSWWGGSEKVAAYTDLNHLYPSEMKANSAKSNWPLGTVNTLSNVKFDNGVCKVGYPVNGQGGNAQYVFEPDDEYKGDFARTYFYMATCYQDYTWKYTWMVQQNTYPTLSPWAIKLLLEWHRADPVSQKERDRNEVVFSYQNNRNPFIDLPELAEYIWGERMGEAFKPGSVDIPVGDPELIAPSVDMTLDFGQVAVGHNTTSRLYVKGLNLSSDLLAKVFSGDADYFRIPESSKNIPVKDVNSAEGFWLNVTYSPEELGQHTSKITFAGEFGSRNVELRGECLPVPNLTPCTALPPTGIEADRYTANWEAPENEVIDYFIVTRTIYNAGDATTEKVVEQNTSIEFLGFDQSESESYSVQSVRLGITSQPSNVVFVDHTGITGVDVEQPLLVRTFPGIIRFICSQPQTNCRIYDMAGNLVRHIDTIYQDLDVDLAPGFYLIVTDQHPTPIKAATVL